MPAAVKTKNLRQYHLTDRDLACLDFIGRKYQLRGMASALRHAVREQVSRDRRPASAASKKIYLQVLGHDDLDLMARTEQGNRPVAESRRVQFWMDDADLGYLRRIARKHVPARQSPRAGTFTKGQTVTAVRFAVRVEAILGGYKEK